MVVSTMIPSRSFRDNLHTISTNYMCNISLTYHPVPYARAARSRVMLCAGTRAARLLRRAPSASEPKPFGSPPTAVRRGRRSAGGPPWRVGRTPEASSAKKVRGSVGRWWWFSETVNKKNTKTMIIHMGAQIDRGFL